jgi:hypothetical protein
MTASILAFGVPLCAQVWKNSSLAQAKTTQVLVVVATSNNNRMGHPSAQDNASP